MGANTGRDGCPVCMSSVFMVVPDDAGGRIVNYQCTSEYRIRADGTVRTIKPCPEAGTLFDESRYRKEPL